MDRQTGIAKRHSMNISLAGPFPIRHEKYAKCHFLSVWRCACVCVVQHACAVFYVFEIICELRQWQNSLSVSPRV